MQLHIFQVIFGLAVFLASVQTEFCQASEELSNRVAEITETNAANDNFSGSVLLAKNNKIIYEKSFGFADKAKNVAFTDKTASNIASVGKMFTSVLILQLAEEKKLRLSDSINKFLPNTKIPNADKITVRHLLTHTSGLGSYMRHADFAKLLKNKVEIDEIIGLIEQQPLVFNEPGARFEYSNSGYIVLGKIIEQMTNKKYSDVLAQKILQPLNLKNTRLEINRADFRGLAKGHLKPEAANVWQSNETQMPTPSADGGVYTTARDLFVFSQALYGGKLIKPESLELMKNRHAEMSVPGLGKMNYGYAMMIQDYPNNAISTGHNGGTPGYGTEFKQYRVGEDDFTLIVISNYDRRVRGLMLEIQKEILNETNEKIVRKRA
jgi:CubicO group peptidase (beta-lactamase class C family)